MRLTLCAAAAVSFCSLGAAVRLPIHVAGGHQLSKSAHVNVGLGRKIELVAKRAIRAAEPTKQKAASKKQGITDIDAAMKNQEAAEAKKRQGGPQARTMTAGVPGVLSSDEAQIQGLTQYITEEPSAVLEEGSVLPTNSSLNNTCGYTVTNQDDGNLVLYHSAGGLPIWSSNTYGAGGGNPEGSKEFTVKMDKGALKIFPFGPTKKSKRPPIWQTETSGNNKAVLTRDGRLVIVDSANGEVKVKLGTVPKVQCNIEAFKKAEAQAPSGPVSDGTAQQQLAAGGAVTDANGGLNTNPSGGADWGADTSGAGLDSSAGLSGGADWGADTSGAGFDSSADLSGGADWGADTSGSGFDSSADVNGGADWGADTSSNFDWSSSTDDTSAAAGAGSDESSFNWGDNTGLADVGLDASAVDSGAGGADEQVNNEAQFGGAEVSPGSDIVTPADGSDASLTGGFGVDDGSLGGSDSLGGEVSWDDSSFSFGADDSTGDSGQAPWGEETTFGGDSAL